MQKDPAFDFSNPEGKKNGYINEKTLADNAKMRAKATQLFTQVLSHGQTLSPGVKVVYKFKNVDALSLSKEVQKQIGQIFKAVRDVARDSSLREVRNLATSGGLEEFKGYSN